MEFHRKNFWAKNKRMMKLAIFKKNFPKIATIVYEVDGEIVSGWDA